MTRKFLVKILKETNDVHLVGEAENGFNAMYLTKMHNPDVIYLDIDLPDSNGFEVAEMILKRDDVLVDFIVINH